MTTTPLRVAVVGVGMIGRLHVRAVLAHPDLELVAVVDPSPASRAAVVDHIAQAGGGRPVSAAQLADALDRVDIDVVAICTPSGLHEDLATQALAAGLHVVIEKPIEIDLVRARRIATAARAAGERGQVVSVISQHRFDPASVAVAKAAHRGDFGILTSGIASVAWYRSQGYYDSGDWRGTWALDGGGAVANQGIHTVDLLVWMLGRPVSVSAETALLAHERIEVEDVAAATVRFENGALGVVLCTTAAYPNLSARVHVHGSQGSAVIDDDRLAYFHVADQAALVAAAAASGTSAAPDVEDQSPAVVAADQIVGGPAEDDHFLAGHLRQYTDVVAAIRTGRAPGVTVDDALLSLAVVRGIYVSATLGAPVFIDDVLAGAHDLVVPRTRGASGGARRDV
jgi:UDP-N-acetyl-2-amino-2-deoxyglucuronate dehydrogenase